MDHLLDEQIVPVLINEWMMLFAIANFIPKKLLLSAIMGVVSTLVRKSQIEFYEGQGERIVICSCSASENQVVVSQMLICMHSAYQMDRKGMQLNRPHYYR